MARQVFFSGNAFGPDFALRAGLLHEVCAVGDLDERVRRQAEAVLKTAPGAVAAAKALCLALGGDEEADIERLDRRPRRPLGERRGAAADPGFPGLTGARSGKHLKRRRFRRLESGWKVAGIRLATF